MKQVVLESRDGRLNKEFVWEIIDWAETHPRVHLSFQDVVWFTAQYGAYRVPDLADVAQFAIDAYNDETEPGEWFYLDGETAKVMLET